MAFMGVVFLQIFIIALMVWYFGTAFLSLTLFIISIVLFISNANANKEGVNNIRKFAPIFTLAISIALFIPLLVTSLITLLMR